MTDAILKFARAQVGKPYKLGGRGPDLWDCSGLTKMAVKQVGYDWYHGATTQRKRGFQPGDPAMYGYWANSGTIDTLPMNQMAFLFNKDKDNASVMAHTGIYDGQGNVVQAGGQYKGVSDKPLNRSRWTYWATLKGADEKMSNVLRKGSSGPEVTALQMALVEMGHDLGNFGPNKNGVDGKFGAATELAVREFQEATGLEVTGVWGELEQAKLDYIHRPLEPSEPTGPEYPLNVEELIKARDMALALAASINAVLEALG